MGNKRESRKCIACGKPLPPEARKDRIFCSRGCKGKAYRSDIQYVRPALGRSCIYNPVGVVCNPDASCQQCGWNPAVEEARKAVCQ
jgi:hypothetical protein